MYTRAHAHARINDAQPRIKSATAHSGDAATEAETAAMQELSALSMYATKQERNTRKQESSI